MKETLTKDLVRELLDYEESTGRFFWKAREPKHFKERKNGSKEHSCKIWNSKYSGKETSSFLSHGYKVININGKHYKAHIIAWLHFYGEYPESFIDHENGNRQDNRIKNLLNKTTLENAKNRIINKRNTSGYPGVWYDKSRNQWMASIKINYKRSTLGRFETKEEAINCRIEAEKINGFKTRLR